MSEKKFTFLKKVGRSVQNFWGIDFLGIGDWGLGIGIADQKPFPSRLNPSVKFFLAVKVTKKISKHFFV